MYPYELFLGLDMYSLLIALGVIGCLVMIRLVFDKWEYEAKFQNFVIITTIVTIFGGYGTAVLTQALYNIKELGKFQLTNDTGSTFYGGLVGGIAIFIIVYFGIGRFLFKDGVQYRRFRSLSELAAPCITFAHGMGRLGCLFAGCCHGAITDKWYGIYMVNLGKKAVPVQLYEALFLFALCALTLWMLLKKKRYCLPTYLFTYGVWRFFIEYARADERGDTFVSFLSPSQLTSIGLILAAVIVLCGELYFDRWRKAKVTDSTGDTENE
ncbi:MAG: prolipoprotein diacylglyceryl transferase [Clostridia bacterium]|nr:prolipoprotein diacylglyceryl transferase [Clostridia bacterium]